MKKGRPTIISLDPEAIVHNFREALRLAGSSPVAPVLKSDAYGHGMIWAAEVLLREGAERLAVSLTAEGLELRKAGITAPILLLGGSFPDEAPDIVCGQLTPMVTAPALARALNEAARSSRRTLPIHLKLETGLGRLGIPLPEFPTFLQFIQGLPSLTLEGIGSTFSSVEDRGKAQMQMEILERAAHEAAAQLKRPLLCHMAHTGGLLRGLTRDGWLVRPGIMLYGYTRGLVAPGIDLRPVLSWETEIFSIRSFPEGHPIGYGGTYRTSKGSRIALLPVGYSDGFLRSYMESGEVLIRGRRAPLVGRFSMDWVMVEVGQIPLAAEGDEVVLIGCQGRERISAEEMAERAGTNIDEIFVSIASRVPRIARRTDSASPSGACRKV